ncbi:phosphopyruvate hydratase [bacterium]|nr:phosphopyruvate hydratase [bacterium]
MAKKKITIKKVRASEILDSRGNPTVRVDLQLSNGKKVWAGVPSGASTGEHEALELRDGDKSRYGGKGVLQAVRNINSKLGPMVVGMDPKKQEMIDELLLHKDGTDNKSGYGANAILGISLAVAKGGARASKKPLYVYLKNQFWPKHKSLNLPGIMVNVMNGGRHADSRLDLQECMIVPQQNSMSEKVRCAAEIFHTLEKVLKKLKLNTNIGNEGGYAPDLKNDEQVLFLVNKAINQAGYRSGQQVKLALDVAAAEFYNKDNQSYELKSERRKLSTDDMIKMYKAWVRKFPIISIEDGLDQDDWEGWEQLTTAMGRKTMLVGDDLFVTDVERLGKGIANNVANAILIKVNQIGTVSETVDAIRLAQKSKYKVVISHRSGETTDDFISDLAVGSGAEFIKTGSTSRGERVVKYNRLMEIEDELK